LQRIVIFANGELPDLENARQLLRAGDVVICADGGTRHASALGIRPHLIIGDLDSAEEEVISKFREEGTEINAYSQDKNETDLELAIDHALGLKPDQILIVAALGGRLDHTLANIALLSGLRLSASDVRLDDGVEEVLLCRNRVEIHGRRGDIVSLIPWQGPVTEVHTTNLKWPLHKETLYPDKTRGVSNEMTGETGSISIGSGLLLIVHRRIVE
jgi:thiamine pyrophosphokinase